MADCDATWLVFGLFLLACGGVPAVWALAAEWRGGLPRHGAPTYAAADPASGMFHEEVLEAVPAGLEGIRNAVEALGRAPARVPSVRGAPWDAGPC